MNVKELLQSTTEPMPKATFAEVMKDKNKSVFIPMNIDTYKGEIPKDSELVVTEGGNKNKAFVLYGFDEIGYFDNLINRPVYGFLFNNVEKVNNFINKAK